MDNIKKIFEAVESQDVKEYKRLLDEDPTLINQRNEHEQTVFWHACIRLPYETIKQTIVDEKIGRVLDVDLCDRWGRFPHDAAKAYEREDVVKLLYQVGRRDIDPGEP